MSGEKDSDGRLIRNGAGASNDAGAIKVALVLTGEQAAAVEGWRVANRIESHPEAVRELVRIGLLSEIGRIYRMISGGRDHEEALLEYPETRG